MSPTSPKTLVQCDFDSTIAEDDVSFQLLDAFAEGDWRYYLEEYQEDKITVGAFSDHSFGMVKADEKTMLDFVFKGGVKIRPGFRELLGYCAKQGIKFVIVSNGLSFYIEAILKDVGLDNIEVFAAQTRSTPDGLTVKYIGPDGNQLGSGFKEAYTRLFLSQGYRVVYIGDGLSDIKPASRADYIFARDNLLAYCREKQVNCTPFDDLNDVVKGLELLEPS